MMPSYVPLILFGFFALIVTALILKVFTGPNDRKLKGLWVFIGLAIAWCSTRLVLSPADFWAEMHAGNGLLGAVVATVFGVTGIVATGVVVLTFIASVSSRGIRLPQDILERQQVIAPADGIERPRAPGAIEVHAVPADVADPAARPNGRIRRNVMDEQIRRIAATERPAKVSNVKKISEDVVLVSSRKRRPDDDNA